MMVVGMPVEWELYNYGYYWWADTSKEDTELDVWDKREVMVEEDDEEVD